MTAKEIDQILRDARDPYLVLGISRESANDPAVVKKQYRNLALKLHPDKNSHPRAADAFKVVSRANTILTDKTKKAIFDQQGADGYSKFEDSGEAMPPSLREVAFMMTTFVAKHHISSPPKGLSPRVLVIFLAVLTALVWPFAYPTSSGTSSGAFSFFPESELGLTHPLTFKASLADGSTIVVPYYVRSTSTAVDTRRLQVRFRHLVRSRCDTEALLVRGSLMRRQFSKEGVQLPAPTKHWRSKYNPALSETVRSDKARLQPSPFCARYDKHPPLTAA